MLAVGGQGGGVLADWIIDVAERNGYLAQSTSVAGVAQRTGATIYYIEMCRDTGRRPVFALSPAQGDVDILIAAELMEAGRAVMRGFVTPDRTTLIASSHRIAAVSEKIEPGDGRASSAEGAAGGRSRVEALHRLRHGEDRGRGRLGDLGEPARRAGRLRRAAVPARRATSRRSRLRAAASRPALPPSLRAYERARGSEPLRMPAGSRPTDAGAARTCAQQRRAKAAARRAGTRPRAGPAAVAGWQALDGARRPPCPKPLRDMAGRGLKKVVDFQDLAYGGEYLDRLDRAVALDDAEHGYALSIAAAKHLANAMCYDDMIRVADLKTRSTRGARVRREVGVERRRGAAGHRIFPSAHRGVLRHDAGAARPLHRGRGRSSPPSSTGASTAAATSAPTA